MKATTILESFELQLEQTEDTKLIPHFLYPRDHIASRVEKLPT
jgi:hypothetical protein